MGKFPKLLNRESWAHNRKPFSTSRGRGQRLYYRCQAAASAEMRCRIARNVELDVGSKPEPFASWSRYRLYKLRQIRSNPVIRMCLLPARLGRAFLVFRVTHLGVGKARQIAKWQAVRVSPDI